MAHVCAGGPLREVKRPHQQEGRPIMQENVDPLAQVSVRPSRSLCLAQACLLQYIPYALLPGAALLLCSMWMLPPKHSLVEVVHSWQQKYLSALQINARQVGNLA